MKVRLQGVVRRRHLKNENRSLVEGASRNVRVLNLLVDEGPRRRRGDWQHVELEQLEDNRDRLPPSSES